MVPGVCWRCRENRRRRPQYVVGPLELGVLIAQRHQLGPLVGGEPVVALANIGLGLPDPAAQGLGMHTEVDGQLLDLRLRFGRPVHPHRTLTQLQRVFPGGGHGRCSSHESHLTLCQHTPHLGGTSTSERRVFKRRADQRLATLCS
jgi:hypothetical protein